MRWAAAIPFVIYAVFWWLVGAEFRGLPPLRRPRINIIYQRLNLALHAAIVLVAFFVD